MLRNRTGAPTWPKPAPTRPGVMDRTEVLQRGDLLDGELDDGVVTVVAGPVVVNSGVGSRDGDVDAGNATGLRAPLHAALVAASSKRSREQIRSPTRPPRATIGRRIGVLLVAMDWTPRVKIRHPGVTPNCERSGSDRAPRAPARRDTSIRAGGIDRRRSAATPPVSLGWDRRERNSRIAACTRARRSDGTYALRR